MSPGHRLQRIEKSGVNNGKENGARCHQTQSERNPAPQWHDQGHGAEGK
jgi:hypothetical protein